MAQCELSGKGPVSKNKVSHSNIKNKSIAMPNIQQKQVFSNSLKKAFSLKLAASTIRTIDHIGSFDSYILKQNDTKLSKRALKIKNQLKRTLNQTTKSK